MIRKIIRFLFGLTTEKIDAPAIDVDVTVIVPAYNEEETLATTLESLKQQTYPIKQIIVIDDCSTDRTGEIAREHGATVIRTPSNTGSKSRAQNFVIDKIKTDYFVTIDADTTLEPHAIERIVPCITDGKTLSACGFVIPQVIQTFWERARFVEYVYGLSLFKRAQSHLKMPLVSSGCFSIFNKTLFESAGRFPEGNIAEDMALTWKAHILGYTIKYSPHAVCYPKDPSNWIQYKGQVLRWYRGFFQCLNDYNTKLLYNIRLLCFVSLYIFFGLLSLVFIAVIFFMVPSLTPFAVGLFLFDFLIGFVFTVYSGIKLKMLTQIIINYPLLLLVTPLNALMFIYAFWVECVERNRLTTWDKGH